MGSLLTKQLLVNVAKSLQKRTEHFSRDEITKKINEIKYLAAQKKIPRLTLRKAVIHLESKLDKIYELEKNLSQKKSQESHKIIMLNKEITHLKKKLELHESKGLEKKVEKMSHLLGEFLSKYGTKIDVELKEQMIKELKIKSKKYRTKPVKDTGMPVILLKQSPADLSSAIVDKLQQKLAVFKSRLEIKSGKDPEKVKQIEQKIKMIEKKLMDYYPKPEGFNPAAELKELPNPPTPSAADVKHTLLFKPRGNAPVMMEESLETELPHPPPPKKILLKGNEEE